MANIKVAIDYTLVNGQPLTFKSPADCSQVTGLTVHYPEGGVNTSKTFKFADAHGNNVGDIDLFASDVLVNVILDVDALRAHVQNADTNAYLENRFKQTADAISALPQSRGDYAGTAEDSLMSMRTPGTYRFRGTVPTDWPAEFSGTKYGVLDVTLGNNYVHQKITVMSSAVTGYTKTAERLITSNLASDWLYNDSTTNVKIQTGSYIGTGTNGTNNPTKVVLNFTPKAFCVAPESTGRQGAVWINGMTAGGKNFSTEKLALTWTADGVSWSTNNGAEDQFNSSGEKYHWIAWG